MELKTSETLFEEGMRTLAARLPETDYTLWLNDLQFKDYDEGQLTLGTQFLIKKERIEARYLDLLTKVFAEHFEEVKSLKIFHEAKATSGLKGAISKPQQVPSFSGKPQATSRSQSKARTAPEAGLPQVLKEHVFKSFLILKENELVYNFAQKAVSQFSRNSPLYFYGPVGVGKTHLLQAVANEVRTRFPFYKIKYVTPDKFIHEFTTSIMAKTDRDFRIRYQGVDLLIIDDIQFFSGKEKSSIEFFHIFNAIYAPGKQMIFASDVPPSELSGFDLRLKSRLAASIIATIPEIGLESRKRLVGFFAQHQKITLTESVLQVLATRLPGNVREIKGAIRTLKATLAIYEEQGQKVVLDESFCHECLKDRFVSETEMAGAEQGRIYSVDMILKEVCKAGEVTLKELRSAKKTKNIAALRQYAAYFLKRHTHLSISEIGGYLGGKTPSAISYSLSSVEKKLTSDRGVRLFFSKIEQQMMSPRFS